LRFDWKKEGGGRRDVSYVDLEVRTLKDGRQSYPQPKRQFLPQSLPQFIDSFTFRSDERPELIGEKVDSLMRYAEE
jgi:hypothetical protein